MSMEFTHGVRRVLAGMSLSLLAGGAAFAQQAGSDYKLVWSDEFDGTELNRKHWNVEVNGDGGGNGELQYYADRPQNVSVKDGNLVLTARRESYRGKSFTSGRVNSNKKIVFAKGKIEASIKLPKTYKGLWPAFWMMGNDYNELGWPKCGETDILEMGHKNGYETVDKSERYFNGALHWGPQWGVTGDYTAQSTAPYSLQDGQYHKFTCVIDDEHIYMYLDDLAEPYMAFDLSADKNSPDDWYNTYTQFTKDQFILFNLAVGGDLFPGISDPAGITAFTDEASMYVDYVRVYQKEGEENIRVNEKDDEVIASGNESIDAVIAKINGELDSTFPYGAIFDNFLFSDYIRGTEYGLQDAGVKKVIVHEYNVNNETSHWYHWNERGQGGNGSITGVDHSAQGYLSYTAIDNGYHGAGFALDFAGMYDLSHLTDDSRLHICFSTESQIPEAVKIQILNNTGIGSYGATLALGEGVDGYKLITKDIEKGKWFTLDMSFAELRELCPSFNPAAISAWTGNVLAVEFPNQAVKAGDNISIDAFYIYSPLPADYQAPERVDPLSFSVADPSVNQTLGKFNDAIYDVFVMGDAARAQITDNNFILHDYSIGGGASTINIWGDYGPTLEAGAGEIAGVDGSNAYVSMNNKMWPGWGAYSMNYSVGGLYNFKHLTDESRLHISFSTETQLDLSTEGGSPYVKFQFLSSADNGCNPALFHLGNGADDCFSVGNLPTKGNWYTLDISLGDLKKLYPGFTYEPVSAWFGQLLAVELYNGAIGNNIVVDAFYLYSPKPDGYVDEVVDINKDGEFVTAALADGNSTFDFDKASDIIPLRVSSDVKARMAGKIRAGYDTDVTNPRFDIWVTENTFEPTFDLTTVNEPNSFGTIGEYSPGETGYTSLTVLDKGWNGGGIYITVPTDFSVLATTPNYYLHIGIRDDQEKAHHAVTFTVNGKKLILNVMGSGGVVTDFKRDGSWRYIDVPLSVLGLDAFQNATAFNNNIISFTIAGGKDTKLDIDNIFFYVGPEYIAPDQPAVDPKVALRASSTSPFVGNKVTLTATTTVPADVTVTKVEFFEGETSIGTDTEAPYTCEFTPAEAKTYSLKAVMTLSDDRTATSAEVKVTARVDNPTVSLAAAPATVTEGEAVTLTANVHVPQGAEAAKVEFFVNDAVVATDTEAPYSYDWTTATTGTFTAKAVMTLTDSRTAASAAVTITVNAKPVDQLQNVPTPKHNADKVCSIFGSHYTNATTFSIGNWGQSTQAELVSINGNDVYKLTDFNYLGWQLAGNIDLSGYTHLHVDYYTPDGNTFAFTPVSPGPKEKVLNQTVTAGQWNSYDVKLSDFTGVALNEVFQFKFDQGGNKTGYIANVYAWKEDGSTEDPDPVDPSDGTVFNFTKDEGANLLDGGYIKYTWNANTSILTVTAHFNEVENGQRTPDNVSFVRPGVTGAVNMISSGKGSYTLEINGLKGGDTVSGYAFYAIPNAEAQTPLKAFTIPTGGDTPDPVEVTYKGITYTDQVQSHNGYITVPYRVVKISDGVETTLTQEEATELNLNVYYAWNDNDDAQAAIALHSPEGVFYCTGLIPGQDYTFYERFFVNGTQIDGKGNFLASATDTGTDNVYKSLTSGSIKPINKDLTTQDPEDARQLLVNTENFDEGFIYWKRMRTGDVACCNEKQFMNLHMYYWAEQLNDGRLRFTFTYVDVDGTSHTKGTHADAKGHQHTGLVPAVHFYDELSDGSFQLITPDIELARFLDEPLRCPDTFDGWTREDGKAPAVPEAVNRAITYKNDAAIEARMKELGYKTVRVETTKAYDETSANIAFNMQFADGGLTLSDVSKLTNIDDNITNGIFNIQNDSEGIRVVDGAIIAPEGSVVFNIHGIPVGGENLAPGIYIVVNGNNACKVLVK